VAPISTTSGLSLAQTTSTAVRGATELQADGSAVIVAATRSRGRVTATVVSRGRGGRFTSAARLRAIVGGPVALALAHGQFVAALTSEPLARGLHRADAITGVAGRPALRLTALPVASSSQLTLRVAAAARAPIVFARANREIENGDGSVQTTSVRTEGYALRPGPAGRAHVAVTLAARQHIGRRAHRQRLRLRLTCATACAYRVLGNLGAQAIFDVARVASRGTHAIDVPYQGPSGSHTTPRAFTGRGRVNVTVAVDDAQGREQLVRRTVLVEP
jgi:hypothetical protein